MGGYWSKGRYIFTDENNQEVTAKGLWNDWTGISNTNASLQAQKDENEKTREYNLMLADRANQQSIDNWNMQNAYNSPSAQKARIESAGLNADMMYGGSGISNTVTSAPSATSSAPATPMDWSALANKKTVGQAIMETLSVQQARANIKKTEAEAKELGLGNDITEKYGIVTAEANLAYVTEMVNKLAVEAEGIDLSNAMKQIEHAFAQVYKDEIVENYLQRLRTSTGLSKNELKEDIETLTLRIAGVNAENHKLERQSKFTTDEWRLVFDIAERLFKMIK